jgi:hypothetical protein
VPSVASIGRRNVTLEWMSPYLPSPEDQTKFGVNITICLASALTAAATQGSLSSTTSARDDEIDGCVIHSRDSKTFRKNIDVAASALIDSSVVYFLADIANLLPQTAYQVRYDSLFPFFSPSFPLDYMA